MISFDNAVQVADTDTVSSLNISAFSETDVLNLILQRSEIIMDHPKRHQLVKQWSKGKDAPLLEVIEKMGAETLIRRAIAFIHLEYQELQPVLETSSPKAVTDIGCGYAIFDLFLAQDFKCKLTLIDLETSEERHFGFEESGSAYSNLDVAKRFLTDNGVAKNNIATINPLKGSVEKVKDQDMAVSFISCGFHYPWSTYAAFFRDAVKPGGQIILDIRKRTYERTMAELQAYGDVQALDEEFTPKSARLLVTKKS
ncbi:class I SAM-dependent methyltransferase [Aliiroseovarius lamellibrachiae]|uniref:class I SAM-dependent methyltransferase n=1 Tax=Aliiroseovarius lamellibrachiae TaxID=1924933 RepID=UPI001BDF9CDF|nr:class I SAM-dependent methyltransferase [Aliiroseovarius lamellibrachiae]MBT2132637.1 class I SAM-dependent methyltransferase [Aliiroseovarius lamellibrachiae]